MAAAAGCNAPQPTSNDPLRGGFPEYASTVLHRGSSLAKTERGFEVIRTESAVKARGGVVLPARGDQPILLTTPAGADVRVREVGLAGEGEIVDRAVTYDLPGGTSYWSATAGGAEEWLLFEPGAIKPGRAAAIWEVAGATPVQRGKAVAIYDEKGRRLVTVNAPIAVLADGTDAPVRLAVRGNSIELFVDARGQGALVDPSWSYVASMNEARIGHTAGRLTTGEVLVAGGDVLGGFNELAKKPASAIGNPPPSFVSSSTEIYDPSIDEWSFLPSMMEARIEHAMVTQPGQLPPDGTVMVTGGRTEFGFFHSTTEEYNAAAGSWEYLADMSNARAEHTATRLLDDRVLVAGGYNDCGGSGSGPVSLAGGANLIGSGFCFLCTAEVYDATANSGSGAWLGTGFLSECRALHTESITSDGGVLVAGGQGDFGVTTSVEKWDPISEQWTFVASMNTPRANHTATRLPDGTLLVTGGENDFSVTSSAEIYDPQNDTWTLVGAMSIERYSHGAALLDDGTVLITGGYDEFGEALFTSEIYDPVTQTFTPTANMNEYHAAHTTTKLLDGTVLVTGGDNFFGDPPISSTCEIFSFKNLIGQPCAAAADCNSGFCADGVCCDSVCDQPCEACSDVARGAIPDTKAKGSGSLIGSGGSDGFCGPVYDGEDPADDCADLDPSSCGTVGTCDGAGSCTIYPADTICKVPVCNVSVAEGGGLCDGAGTCVLDPDEDCEPYACAGGVCQGTCVDPADCSPFAYCDGVVHECVAKKPNGNTAFDPVQCVSGFIADGVCCDTACDGACEACSVATGGSENGTCTPLSNVGCDDGDECTQVDICQNGACIGSAPVPCPGDTSCQGGLACDPASGACSVPTPPKQVGAPCDDGLTCTENDACVLGGTCAGSESACTPTECQSGGACVEGQGCQFTNLADYSACTKDNNPCTLEWCIDGECLANNAADLSPCPGGVCIGGTCIPDGSFNPTGGGGGSAGSGGSAGGSGGSTGGSGDGGSASGTGGSAGNPAANGDEPAYKLLGAGCSTSNSGSSGPAGLAFAALAFAAAAGARRRKRG